MKAIIKLFAAVSASLLIFACEESEIVDGGGVGVKMEGLVLSFDKSVIKSDGNDVVTFSAYYNGENVNDDVAFFILSGTEYIPIDRTFSTDKNGEYSFQAAYKTTYSDVVSISAISRDIPAAATDLQKSNTSFVRRTFFNQHTGSQCPNCPFMTYLIKKTLTDDVKDKVVLASLRNYSGEAGFASVPNPASSWPYLHIDYADTYPYNGSVDGLKAKINAVTAEPAMAGISASPVYYEDGQLIVKVAVKAAETAEYNVGLWLMQDNFKKTQVVDNSRLSLLEGTWGESYHYHNNCVRVAESKYLGSHVGYPLGKIEAGQTAEWIFLVTVNIGQTDLNGDGQCDVLDSWWVGKSKINLDDLHFAAFVTAREGSRYNVVNAIDFKYNEERPFEYIK